MQPQPYPHKSPKAKPLDDCPPDEIRAVAGFSRTIRQAGGACSFHPDTMEGHAATILHASGAARIIRCPFGEWWIIGATLYRGPAGIVFRWLLECGGEVAIYQSDIDQLGLATHDAIEGIEQLKLAGLISIDDGTEADENGLYPSRPCLHLTTGFYERGEL